MALCYEKKRIGTFNMKLVVICQILIIITFLLCPYDKCLSYNGNCIPFYTIYDICTPVSYTHLDVYKRQVY